MALDGPCPRVVGAGELASALRERTTTEPRTGAARRIARGFGKIGLAVIASEQASAGNMLGVSVGGESVSATVDVPPIYDTEKRRPRA